MSKTYSRPKGSQIYINQGCRCHMELGSRDSKFLPSHSLAPIPPTASAVLCWGGEVEQVEKTGQIGNLCRPTQELNRLVDPSLFCRPDGEADRASQARSAVRSTRWSCRGAQVWSPAST